MPLRSRLQASPCSDSPVQLYLYCTLQLTLLHSAALDLAAILQLVLSCKASARPVQGRKPASLRQRSGSPTHARPPPAAGSRSRAEHSSLRSR